LDSADIYARQFDRISHLEIPRGVESGLDWDTAIKEAPASHHFKQYERSHEDQGKENAQSSFQRVFHSDQLSDVPC
jgi:hypothetical protein